MIKRKYKHYIKKHPSKVSYGLLACIFLVFYGPLLAPLIQGKINETLITSIAFLSLLFAFISHLFLNTEYTIDNYSLKIKCGLIHYPPIAIKGIKEVSERNSITSSPAPSFDRIKIKYGSYNELIISTKNKKDFVRDLMEVNPNIIHH